MEMRFGEVVAILMKEKKHVQVTTMMLIDLINRIDRFVSKGKIGCARSVLTVVKKYFGVVITDIKDQKLREYLTERIKEVETKVEEKAKEIFGGEENES